MSPQTGRHLLIFRLQSSDHRLEKGGVMGKIFDITRHAIDYHKAADNSIKTIDW